ncbi:MAG: hypothetical protein GY839_09075 [candidate division Zixibacteria bacterium]|nr:hypothetical protein [candidate division Zixibacteria bacterium]
MGIVTLPDFVVDVAVNEVETSIPGNRGSIDPLDVGGRAGRLAWVLQEFGGLRNGWYNIKYIAKAGDVGRIVLERRFTKRNNYAGFEAISLRHIIPSNQDYDWIHIYGKMKKPVESSHDGLDVKIEDIDKSSFSLTDLFIDSRYIVISSKHADHAISAISLVGEGLDRLSGMLPTQIHGKLPIGILLDLSALGNCDHIPGVIASFAKVKERASAFVIDSTALCAQELDSGKEHFEHVLVRENEIVRLGDSEYPLSASGPTVREAFTAGYTLATACDLGWKLLRRWYDYFPKIRPIDGSPHKSYPQEEKGEPGQLADDGDLLPSLDINGGDPISPADRVRFAALLAEATESTPLCYSDLVKTVTPKDTQLLTPIEKLEVKYATSQQDAPKDQMNDCEKKASMELVLKKRFQDPESEDTLSLHAPPSKLDSFVSSCRLRDARRVVESPKSEIDKAVMFDLDATLIDSSKMIRACWKIGLRTFFNEVGIRAEDDEIKTIIDVYQTFIYKNYERFHLLLRDQPDIPPELQPCDFRQVWNHPYAWAALLLVLNLDSTSPEIDRSQHKQWRDALDKHKQWLDVLDKYNQWREALDKYKKEQETSAGDQDSSSENPNDPWLDVLDKYNQWREALDKYKKEQEVSAGAKDSSSEKPNEQSRDVLDKHNKEQEASAAAKDTSAEKPNEKCDCDICSQLEPMLRENSKDTKDGEKRKNRKKPVNLEDVRRLATRNLREQLTHFRFAIREGRNAFWNVDYPSYPQVRSCVEMLRAMPGCEVYVVTEGHEETQLMKLKCTGLDDLFPAGRVLSTGAASAAKEVRNDLTKLIQQDKHTRDFLLREVNEVNVDEFKRLTETLNAIKDAVDLLHQLLELLYLKANKRFYSAVIDSIRLKPESPAQVLQSLLERGRHAIEYFEKIKDKISEGRPIKFFMIGDRYDNDCEPLLKIFPSADQEVGVGTCRLMSGKRSWEEYPPEKKPAEPGITTEVRKPTMYVCDTLAQVAHIMHSAEAWRRIIPLKAVSPPALLEVNDDEIVYGPTKEGKLKGLAPQFANLALAIQHEALRKEPAVHEMLGQIQRDIAVCDATSIARLFQDLREQVEAGWQLPKQSDPALVPEEVLEKGALKILAAVNWWRWLLKRPLLPRADDITTTLEWTLSSQLLAYYDIQSVTIGDNRMSQTRPEQEDIKDSEILEAIPYSFDGIEIIKTIGVAPSLGIDHRKNLTDWIVKSDRLTR